MSKKEIFNNFLWNSVYAVRASCSCTETNEIERREKRDEGREKREEEESWGSRNNVTQLKIQCADMVVYQMEIHTRILLSITHHSHKMYLWIERRKKSVWRWWETMIEDNSSGRWRVDKIVHDWAQYSTVQHSAEQNRGESNRFENDFIYFGAK